MTETSRVVAGGVDTALIDTGMPAAGSGLPPVLLLHGSDLG